MGCSDAKAPDFEGCKFIESPYKNISFDDKYIYNDGVKIADIIECYKHSCSNRIRLTGKTD